jgi:hypothetical protein
MVGTEDLPEKDPQGDQRGKDPVLEARAAGTQRLLNDLLGEDVGERQITVLEKLVVA